jgi:23S rRNA pseudouridine2605 synthase
MRLNQYLAACGLGSRRRCEELIIAGRVAVNAAPGQLGTRVQDGDAVTLDGRRVERESSAGVWLLHKPAAMLCTASDEFGRRTVFDLARAAGLEMRLFAVGRLDMDTTGLLLLTNDGALGYRLTHPSQGVEKEYEATIATRLSETALEHLRGGVELEDGPTAPCAVTQEARAGGGALVRLVLHEGRKRQVRRMLQAVGAPVQALHRVRIGSLRLGDLGLGQLRPATPAEIAALQAESGPRGAEADATRHATRPDCD